MLPFALQMQELTSEAALVAAKHIQPLPDDEVMEADDEAGFEFDPEVENDSQARGNGGDSVFNVPNLGSDWSLEAPGLIQDVKSAWGGESQEEGEEKVQEEEGGGEEGGRKSDEDDVHESGDGEDMLVHAEGILDDEAEAVMRDPRIFYVAPAVDGNDPIPLDLNEVPDEKCSICLRAAFTEGKYDIHLDSTYKILEGFYGSKAHAAQQDEEPDPDLLTNISELEAHEKELTMSGPWLPCEQSTEGKTCPRGAHRFCMTMIKNRDNEMIRLCDMCDVKQRAPDAEYLKINEIVQKMSVERQQLRNQMLSKAKINAAAMQHLSANKLGGDKLELASGDVGLIYVHPSDRDKTLDPPYLPCVVLQGHPRHQHLYQVGIPGGLHKGWLNREEISLEKDKTVANYTAQGLDKVFQGFQDNGCDIKGMKQLVVSASMRIGYTGIALREKNSSGEGDKGKGKGKEGGAQVAGEEANDKEGGVQEAGEKSDSGKDKKRSREKAGSSGKEVAEEGRGKRVKKANSKSSDGDGGSSSKGAGMVSVPYSCQCTTGCKTNLCPCKKASSNCNSYCHNSAAVKGQKCCNIAPS